MLIFLPRYANCKCEQLKIGLTFLQSMMWMHGFSSLLLLYPEHLLSVVFLISQILHLKGDRKDFDFVKSSLSAEGFDVVYDINGVQIPTCSHLLCLFFTNNFIIHVTLRVQSWFFITYLSSDSNKLFGHMFQDARQMKLNPYWMLCLIWSSKLPNLSLIYLIIS